MNQGLMKKVLCFLDTETPRRLSCLGLAALITTKEPWTLGTCNWPFELNFFEFKESHNCKPYIFFPYSTFLLHMVYFEGGLKRLLTPLW